MRKLLSYITSVLFYLAFLLILVFNHIAQVIAIKLFGYNAHKRVIDALSVSTLIAMRLVGARMSFNTSIEIPDNRPLIIISNHQSMFDIPAIGWVFRKHHPKYIAKKELGKNIPAVSYNLNHGGSVLIDRSNQKQALGAILRFGRYIEENKFAASIFPEGTRSRTGKMRKFKPGGIQALIKTIPSALIIPFVIEGHSKLQPKGLFPLTFGTKLTYTILDPIEPSTLSAEVLLEKVELQIKAKLDNK